MKVNWSSVFFLICIVTGYIYFTPAIHAENLLSDPGFEQDDVAPGHAPDGWLFLSENDTEVNGGLVSSGARTGQAAVFLGQPDSDETTWEVLVISIPVKTGAHYQFSAWIKPDDAEPLKHDAAGSISIEWKDSRGDELKRITGSQWNRDTFSNSQAWTQMSAAGRAPDNAVSASFCITYHVGIVVGSGGKFLIDDTAINETLR
jgi:hypothetical protein